MAKRLEITGLFNNSQIRRAFGDMIADTTRAKNAWTEMTRKIKTDESELKTIIQSNVREIKEKERAIASLQKQMSNPLNAYKRDSYQHQIDAINKYKNGLIQTTRELERMNAQERRAAMFSPIQQAGGRAIAFVGRVASTAAYAAGGALIGGAAQGIRGDISLDRDMMLAYGTAKATQASTKAFMEQQVLEISSKTGISNTAIAQSYNKLLSSGFAPKAKEGSAAYMQELEVAGKMAEKISMSAKAVGEDPSAYQDALIYTAGAYGKDIRNTEDLNKILDGFAFALDNGMGTMAEYSAQFSKFMPTAQLAGWDFNEAIALFAETTKHYNPNEAGHVVNNLAKEFTNPMKYAQYAAQKLDKLSEKNLLVGSANDKKVLKNLDSKQLTSVFYDEKGASRGMMASLSRLNAIYSKLESDSAKGLFINSISGGNSVVAKSLMMLLGESGTYTDENGIEQKIQGVNIVNDLLKNASSMSGLNESKLAQLNSSVSAKYDKMTAAFSNGMIQFANALEPTIMSLMDFLTRAAGKLGPIAERIQYALGGITEKEKEENLKRQNLLLKTLDTSGAMPSLLTSNVDMEARKELYNNLKPLFLASSGMKENELIDKILLGEGNVSKGDFVKAYGGNAPKAISYIESTLMNSDGASNWFAGAARKMLGDKGVDIPQYVEELSLLREILEQKGGITEQQNAEAIQELKNNGSLLQIIASKDFGGGSPFSTSASGSGMKSGTVPFLSNPTANFLSGFNK